MQLYNYHFAFVHWQVRDSDSIELWQIEEVDPDGDPSRKFLYVKSGQFDQKMYFYIDHSDPYPFKLGAKDAQMVMGKDIFQLNVLS